MLPVLIALSFAHTPKHFLKSSCGHSNLALSNINVSQVTYIDVDPACDAEFTIKERCDFDVISLHRFHPTHKADAFVEIISPTNETRRLTEINSTREAEPFTTTQYVTTIKRENLTTSFASCTVKVGAATKTKLQLVVGKAEEWWLFLTIPYYAPRVQWEWAFSSVSYWYWPYLMYLALIAVLLIVLSYKYDTKDKKSFTAVLVLILACFCVDYLVPVIMVIRKLESYWPPGAFWNFVVFYKLRGSRLTA